MDAAGSNDSGGRIMISGRTASNSPLAYPVSTPNTARKLSALPHAADPSPSAKFASVAAMAPLPDGSDPMAIEPNHDSLHPAADATPPATLTSAPRAESPVHSYEQIDQEPTEASQAIAGGEQLGSLSKPVSYSPVTGVPISGSPDLVQPYVYPEAEQKLGSNGAAESPKHHPALDPTRLDQPVVPANGTSRGNGSNSNVGSSAGMAASKSAADSPELIHRSSPAKDDLKPASDTSDAVAEPALHAAISSYALVPQEDFEAHDFYSRQKALHDKSQKPKDRDGTDPDVALLSESTALGGLPKRARSPFSYSGPPDYVDRIREDIVAMERSLRQLQKERHELQASYLKYYEQYSRLKIENARYVDASARYRGIINQLVPMVKPQIQHGVQSDMQTIKEFLEQPLPTPQPASSSFPLANPSSQPKSSTALSVKIETDGIRSGAPIATTPPSVPDVSLKRKFPEETSFPVLTSSVFDADMASRAALRSKKTDAGPPKFDAGPAATDPRFLGHIPPAPEMTPTRFSAYPVASVPKYSQPFPHVGSQAVVSSPANDGRVPAGVPKMPPQTQVPPGVQLPGQPIAQASISPANRGRVVSSTGPGMPLPAVAGGPFPGAHRSGAAAAAVAANRPEGCPTKVTQSLALPHGDTVCAIAISVNSRYIFTGSKLSLKMWDYEHKEGKIGKCIHALDCFADLGLGVVRALRPTRDGKRLLVGGEGSHLVVIDIEKGLVVTCKLKTQNVAIYSIQVSTDSRLAYAACGDGIVRIWDLYQGKIGRTLSGHTDLITGVALTPMGDQLFTASLDRTVRVWDMDSGEVGKWHFGSQVFALGISPVRPNIVCGLENGEVELVDVNDHDGLSKKGNKHTQAILTVKYAPNGEWLITTGQDCRWIIWCAKDLGALFAQSTGGQPILASEVSSCGNYFVISSGDTNAFVYTVKY
ncbi:WD40-repeat-containing domain protein [Polychytrium aggregatum]|uniref:WD40-repeat-containing domain protein n=1 Tax=Polychytrium aggregatum TaxID=110093 RepID=UPI0022FE70A9|nr:WD40-repeat-containing domain protein [Polychytrium aggregatum]KAI9205417.1 WD40-repeat-containing domain protein [Polychytrium aggregatum]